MDIHSPLSSRRERAADWLIEIVLPAGWLVLLTGMFWIGDRSLYHKAYYLLLAAPTLLAIILRPAALRTLLSSPLLIAFILLSAYTVITLIWSSTDTASSSLAKRPLYILLLFSSACLIALQAPKRLELSVQASALIASLAGLLSLAFYLYSGADGRLTGYGALYNPLLSSHVYGFFMAYWTASWFLRKNIFDPLTLASLAIFGALLLATGSRTPIMAMAICLLWLIVSHWNKRSLIALVTAGTVGTLLLFVYPGALTGRGLSSRPEIWGKAWQQILEAPWLGHGYDAPLKIWISAHDFAMADPHNMLLAVLYYCGAIGLVLWLSLYAIALTSAWRMRKQPMTVIASALLVYGFAASMTEGGAFISRPKEHWFLIWIPMALIAASMLIKQNREHVHAPIEKA